MDKIILWNPRSIQNKEIELNFLIYKENPDLIALCETWLREKDKLKIQNYVSIRKDRKKTIRGRVSFFNKK